jgi:hypothetical protein
LQDPISKNFSQKRAGGVAQSKGPDFKLQVPPQNISFIKYNILIFFKNMEGF